MDIKNKKLLFKSWYPYLKDVLDTSYFEKLISIIDLKYKDKTIVPVNKASIFKPFQNTDFKKLKVVIIGESPYQNYSNPGNAFANSDDIVDSSFSSTLLAIKDCIESNVKDGVYLGFDPTLENWSDQGVLLLNASLTAEIGNKVSHLKYWQNFNREVIKTICKYNNGTIFCIWGENAKYYEQFINKESCYIMKYYPPDLAVKLNLAWACDHFNEINDILEKNNGKSERINW